MVAQPAEIFLPSFLFGPTLKEENFFCNQTVVFFGGNFFLLVLEKNTLNSFTFVMGPVDLFFFSTTRIT